MNIVDDRRFPCCGARFTVDFAPGERVQRRCRPCRRRFEVELVPDEPVESSWRLSFVTTDRDSAPTGRVATRARRRLMAPAAS